MLVDKSDIQNKIIEVQKKRAAVQESRKNLVEEFKSLAFKKEESSDDDEDKTRMDRLEEQVEQHDKDISDHDDQLEDLYKCLEMDRKSAEDIDDGTKAFDKPIITKGMNMDNFGGRSNVVIKNARPVNEKKGTRFARFLVGEMVSKLAKNHNAGPRFLRDTYEDKEVADALYHAQGGSDFDYNDYDKSVRNQKAQNSTLTQASGGALIPQDFHAELIDLLYAQTVVRGSGGPVYQTTYGNATWPRLNGGATAYWAPEETDIPISNVTFDDIQTNVHKLTAMVPVSNDLIRRSPLSVPDIIRNNMVRMMALKEDQAFLWGTGSGASDPITGIFAQTLAANKFNVTSNPAGDYTDLRLVNDVLSTLELALIENNVPVENANFLFHPQVKAFLNTLTDQVGRYFFREELDRNMLLGYPIKGSTQFATNLAGNGVSVTATTTAASSASTTLTVPTAGVAVGSYVTGTGITTPPTVVSITSGSALVVSAAQTVGSGVALTFAPATAAMVGLVAWNNYFIADTMQMLADSSTEASYIDGTSTMRSTFSRDQSVFRLIREMDLGCMHPQGAAFATVPGWTPTKYTSFNSYTSGNQYVTQTADTMPSSAGSANPQ